MTFLSHTGVPDPRSARRFICLAVCLAMVATAVSQQPKHEATEPSAASAQGEQTFAMRCSMCHGSDGRGGEGAPNIATSRNIQALTDSELMQIVQKGIPSAGMPSFASLGDQQIQGVVAYLRTLQGKSTVTAQFTGDAQSGRALFFGKASCSKCHMVNGSGGFIASDLTTYSAGQQAPQILTAITEPNKNLDNNSDVINIVTRAGQKISGVIRNEDNFSLVLLSTDGSFHLLQKPDITERSVSSHSLMPDNYGSTLTSTELNDLVSYLLTLRRDPPRPASGQSEMQPEH